MSEDKTESNIRVVTDDNFDSEFNVNNVIEVQNEISQSTTPILRTKDGVRKQFDSTDGVKGNESTENK